MPTERDLVFGTAGHIDHGKTALVRALTGVDTDRLPAERERGITIDLGFAALNLGEDRLALVDVPGHERFIRNMLAGATGMDCVLLVVAADDSVMPQTREHLEILRYLKLYGGVIALTKCDLAEPGWLDLVEAEVRALVAGTFLENAPIVRTSAHTGLGIDTLKSQLADAARSAANRLDLGGFRMAIDRVFTRAGHGTIVTGTVASGEARVGDALELWPGGRSVRVRGLHRHDHAVESIGRGARAAVNLGGVHHTEVVRGHTLASPGFLRESRVIGVTVATSADAPRPLRHRGRYRLHLGTAEVAATLVLFEGDRLEPGASALAELRTAEPLVAVSGQPFVIREESPAATLGGGTVLAPTGPKIRRRDASAIARLARRDDPDPVTRLSAVVETTGRSPATPLDAVREAAIPLGEVAERLDALAHSGELVEVRTRGRRVVSLHRGSLAAIEERIVRALGRLHERSPRQSTIRRAHLLASFPDLDDPSLLDAVVDGLRERGILVGDAGSVALREFVPKLSHSERKLKDALLAQITAGGIAPPDSGDLAKEVGARASVVPELLSLLVDEGRLVEVSPGSLFLSTEAEASLRETVRTRFASREPFAMADLRDALGTTRKFAVPIGEYLDRIGLTHREGDTRRLAIGANDA